MIERSELNLSSNDYQAAFNELSFLVDLLVLSIKDLVGSGASSIARAAGRQMAKKLPVHLIDPGVDEALITLNDYFGTGLDLSTEAVTDGVELTFTLCPIRDVCKQRGAPIGGDMCTIFHHYLSGVVAGLTSTDYSSRIVSEGETCVTRLLKA